MFDILICVVGTTMGLALGLAPFAALACLIYNQATERSL